MQKDLSLSQAQIDYIRALIRDYRIAGGKAADFVTPGWFADFPFVDFNREDIGGGFASNANFAFNQNVTDLFFLDMPAAITTYRQSLQSGRTLSSSKDLRRFKLAGGKAILWVGTRDNAVNPAQFLDYYLSAKKTSGQSVQFYLAPGVEHCAIDRSRDPIAGLINVNISPSARTAVLKQLEQWIETGQAPQQIPAVSGDLVNQRPWCPYPLVARRINPNLPDPNYGNYRCVNLDRDDNDHEGYPVGHPED
jgi:hypothetical protein